MVLDSWVVWVWQSLGILWVLGGGGGVGVPGGVTTITAGLVGTGGLVGVGAVVGLWGWDWSLVPLPSIESEELWSVLIGLSVHVSEVLKDFLVVVLEGLLMGDGLTELVVFVNAGWLITVELDGGDSSDKGNSSKFHRKNNNIIYMRIWER